ncbi:Corticotropin-releasing factor receptor 2 [Bulinus truncatus]|nr:Corticotropin-releasing factor receptor 2 [Bulinus truncatus]
MVEMQCFESMFTDTTLNVTKRCLENGTWEKSNFLTCLSKPHTMNSNYDTNLAIYTVGYSLTNLTLILAIAIFLYFKSLRCLRNLIHCNLMLAMFISNIKWLVLKETITQFTHSSSGVLCRTLASVVTYFNTAVYFWMFVEGIYLFSVVIYAYEAHKIRLWHFLLVGWGCPLVVVIIWASLLIRLGEGVDSCWLPRDASLSAHTLIVGSCLTVLVINAIIVVIVIWVLVRKLRTSAAIESQQVTKAVKAIVVLLPLLGLHFILTHTLAQKVSAQIQKKPSFIIRNFVPAFQLQLANSQLQLTNSLVQLINRFHLHYVPPEPHGTLYPKFHLNHRSHLYYVPPEPHSTLYPKLHLNHRFHLYYVPPEPHSTLYQKSQQNHMFPQYHKLHRLHIYRFHMHH